MLDKVSLHQIIIKTFRTYQNELHKNIDKKTVVEREVGKWSDELLSLFKVINMGAGSGL